MKSNPKISVLIPCYNEGITIKKVVSDFKKQLPEAKIIVYDNDSTDNTVQEAKKAGAVIKHCYKKGKGNVVQKMFEQEEADTYIMVDGDDTYPAEEVKTLLEIILKEEADMAVGSRMEHFAKENKRVLHSLGNKLILKTVNFCFPNKIRDMLSGYRVMTRELVKNLNLLSSGFTIETEITIKTLENGFKIKEVPIHYKERPKGSVSKLSTFSDGMYILQTILSLFRDYRPMQFFLVLSAVSFSLSVGFGYSIVIEYFTQGHISRIPSLLMSIFFILITIMFFSMGFVASSVHSSKQELIHLINKVKKR